MHIHVLRAAQHQSLQHSLHAFTLHSLKDAGLHSQANAWAELFWACDPSKHLGMRDPCVLYRAACKTACAHQ